MSQPQQQQQQAQLPPGVVEAIQAMQASQSTDNNTRENADRWLQEFQRKADAWSVCDAILRQPQLPMEVYFLAANTLSAKIQYQYHELPDSDSRVAFRDALLQHLVRFSDPSARAFDPVRRQICLCVSMLVALMEEWGNEPLDFLVQNMANNAQLAPSLLDILSTVPEHVNGERLRLADDRAKVLEAILTKFGSQLLQLLAYYLNVANNEAAQLQSNPTADSSSAMTRIERLRSQLFSCFGSWVSHVDFNSAELASNAVFEALFEAVKVPSLFLAAQDAIHQLLYRTRFIDKQEPVVNAIIPKVLGLSAVYEGAVQQDDPDVCYRLASIFVRMGYSYMPLVLQGSPQSFNTVELILLCTGSSMTRVSLLMFDFWYHLSRELGRIPDAQQRDRKIIMFGPYYQRLVDTVRKIMKYPTDSDSWDKDEREEYKKFRFEAAQCFTDAIHVIGANHVLRQLYEALCVEAERYAVDPDRHWRAVEACLQAVRSIARKIIDDRGKTLENTDMLPKILELLPRFDRHHEVKYTALLVIGRYADWINKNPSFVKPLLQYVISALSDEKCLPAASLSFKNMCDGCAHHLTDNSILTDLFQLYHGSTKIHVEDQKEIIEGICMVVLATPKETFQEALNQLVIPIVDDVQAVMNEATSLDQQLSAQPKDEALERKMQAVQDSLCVCMDRLAQVFQSITPPSRMLEKVAGPLVEVLGKLWPMLEQVLKLWRTDGRVMEHLCRAWKYAIKACGIYFAPFLGRLLKEISALFTESPHSSFLYVASICVDTFGPHNDFKSTIVEIFHVFSRQSFPVLANADSFTEHPDIASDYFDLIVRFLDRCPHIVLFDNLLEEVVLCAIQGLHVHHFEAFSTIMMFFVKLMLQALPPLPRDEKLKGPSMPEVPPQQNVQLVEALLAKYGQTIMNKFVEGIAGALPVKNVKLIGMFFDYLMRFNPQVFQHLLVNALQRVPDTTNPDKNTFVQKIFTETYPEKMKRQTVRLHRSFIRLFKGGR